MNTGKNRVKGLKTELFKKKYQTDPLVTNPSDMLGIPDLTKSIESSLNYRSTPYDYGTPQTEPKVKRENPEGFMAVNIDTKAEKAKEETTKIVPSQEEDKSTLQDYIRTGIGVVSAAKGVYDDAQNRQDINERIQNLNDRPRYMPNEYDFMGRPGSQGVIYAKNGAQIRTGTSSGAEEAELERGEMFMMPNLQTYVVGGKKHSQGGEDFVLPEGTIVFSDHLKVPGLKNTFAVEAKKFDVTKYKTVLENPHAKAVDRTTAEVMMDRNMKKLQELFQIQQAMNGNSTGEMEPEGKRMGQSGLRNSNTVTAGMFPKVAPRGLTPEQQKAFYQNQGMFTNPNYTNEVATQRAFPNLNSTFNEEDLSNVADAADAETKRQKNFIEQVQEKVNDVESKGFDANQKQSFTNPGAFDVNQSFYGSTGVANLGSTPTPQLNTATNQNKVPLADEQGNKSMTNATDPSSIYMAKTPDGRSYFVENQGEFANKPLTEQYGNDPTNLLKNRMNQYYDKLNPLLTDSYNLEINSAKDVLQKNGVDPEKIKIQSGEELINVLETGEPFLRGLRNFYKSMGREQDLFDAKLDRGYDPDVKNQKAAKLAKEYIESSQFAKDAASGNVNPKLIAQLNEKPEQYTAADGSIRYRMPKASVNLEFSAKYQTAYRAIAAVKNEQKKKGKEGDLLKGFRVAPEGLSDQTFLGMPISEVSGREGNTEIGQLTGFEDDPVMPTKKVPPPVKREDPGKGYNKQLEEAGMGKYRPEGFDYPQLAPEIYGMASSQMFPYAIPDYNAPYLMPQTLNIQPQLQDIDNSYVAALNSGADPNSALIATLGAKQRIFSEKQNFDAQQRAQADQINNQNRFQEDIYDMQALDRVYNTLIAQADDAVTAQRQALIASASQKRAVWKQEETKKQFWYNNFVRNYDYDPKTRSLTVKKDAGEEFANQVGSLYGYSAIPEVDAATKAKEKTTSKTTTTK